MKETKPKQQRSLVGPNAFLQIVASIAAVTFGLMLAGSVGAQSADEIQEQLQAMQQQMKLVADSLEEKLDRTQVVKQQQIADQLAFLVRQFSSSNQSGEQSSQSSSSTGTSKTMTGQGTGMASSQSQGDEKNELSALNGLNEKQLILKIWGEMPADKYRPAATELSPRFLPGYEAMIREYYRKIAK